MHVLQLSCYIPCAATQEEVVSRTLARHGLRLPVVFSHGKVGNDLKYPYIAVASLIQSLDKAGKLYTFIGLGEPCNTLEKAGPGLENFWRNYRYTNSGHEVFTLADSGQLQLKHCLPVYCHGDEGTTYKKDGCFVFSLHSPLGRGTLSNKLGPLDDGSSTPHTNFVGNSLETRFMLGALLRDSWIDFQSSIAKVVVVSWDQLWNNDMVWYGNFYTAQLALDHLKDFHACNLGRLPGLEWQWASPWVSGALGEIPRWCIPCWGSFGKWGSPTPDTHWEQGGLAISGIFPFIDFLFCIFLYHFVDLRFRSHVFSFPCGWAV